MTSQYRRCSGSGPPTDDAAFAEYVSDLVFPVHLRETSRFADGHERAVVLAPRGHAKTRFSSIGPPAGSGHAGAAAPGHPDRSRRRCGGPLSRNPYLVEQPRFAEVFPFARAASRALAGPMPPGPFGASIWART